MNKCADCNYTSDNYDGMIPCDHDDVAIISHDNFDECPFCGLARISPQVSDRAKCGCFYTEYVCGTKIVVNYVCSRFVAVGRVSDTCSYLCHNAVDDMI